MAAPLYDELAQAAVDLLVELGQPIQLKRGGAGTGTYDPSTGTGADVAEQTFTASGVALNYTRHETDGTLILEGDRRLYIAPDLGTVPTSGDVVLLEDGTQLKVVTSRPLAPAGVVVLHDVQVRGV